MPFCRKCGYEIEEKNVYCIKCGRPVIPVINFPSDENDTSKPVDMPAGNSLLNRQKPEAISEPVKKQKSDKALFIGVIAVGVVVLAVFSSVAIIKLKDKYESAPKDHISNDDSQYDSKSSKSDSQADSDADSTGSGKRVNVVSTIEPAESDTLTQTPTEELFDTTYAGYREVLVAYHNELKEVEKGNQFFDTDELKSCALTDLTGDGFPELVVLYWSDFEHGTRPKQLTFADISIYTINSGETSATEILHLSQVVNNDVFSVLTILDNGNLLFKYANFSFTERSFIEYTFDGLTFQPVNILEFKSSPADDDVYYSYNGEELSQGEYETRISYFSDKVSEVFMNIPNDLNEDWKNAVINAPEFSITYEEAWDLIAPAHNSEPILTQDQAIEAFENYMDENYAWDGEGFAPYGTASNYWCAEEYCDNYTCSYALEGYVGANAYLYKYFFMDLTTGSVYTIEYEDSTYSAVENPGIRILGTEYDVFNGLDYIG